MFGTLARVMYRRRWYVVGFWFIVLVLAITQAAQVGKVLGPGEFVQKGSDSDKARVVLSQQFHQDDQKTTLVVLQNSHATIRDASFRNAAHTTESKIWADRGLHVQSIDNPLVSNNRQLISKDGHAVALAVSSSLKESKIEDQIDHLRSLVKTPGFNAYVTGTAAINHDDTVQSLKDLKTADSITIPILIIILLLVFGSLVAASLPLVLALFSVVLSLAMVYFFGHFLTTSVYVENVVMFLGLGISIDYSLFIVYRFREELRAANGDREAAVVRTMETTGRAIFFSGVTVAIGLASLMLSGLSFMVTMGLGGILVPVSALLVAMTLLPALLGIVGPKVNRFRVIPSRFLGTGESGMWHRLAGAIMARPILSGGAVLAILLALTFPLTQMTQSYGSFKNAPKVESVRGFIYMRDHFATTPDPARVVVQHTGGGTLLSAREIAGMRALETQLRHNSEAAKVIGPAEFLSSSAKPSGAALKQLSGRYLSSDLQSGLITVIPKHEAGTKKSDDLVRGLRSTASGLTAGALKGDRIYVGGAAADSFDFDTVLLGRFPIIIAVVLVLTYGILFFAFRSVFLPLKAVLLNLLSVGATYGLLELVFQRGIGSGILGFTPEDGVAPWVPVFLFAFLFGISMDYEVFLLSRMRERWLQTGDNRASVAFGLSRTGRLITSAAAIMIVAFSGILIGHEIGLKEFGFGLVASIALDATLIRLILVPSIMELMGDRNWWVPSFLHGFAERGAAFSEELADFEKPEQALAS
jgi:uncharacterized membrane protein YdfJ with MMPL/SSD domain